MVQPTKIQPGQLATVAYDIVTSEGADAVTMRSVAARLGVRAPSLYFHVRSREELLEFVIDQALEELGATLRTGIRPGDPAATLHGIADAYIAFASREPNLFALLFGPCPSGEAPASELSAEAAEPLVTTCAELAGEERALDLSQALWSLVHGYCVLDQAGQFRAGGNPTAAVHYAIDLVLGGLSPA